jgi:poly(3-hydroxybutyrate) depolymerase
MNGAVRNPRRWCAWATADPEAAMRSAMMAWACLVLASVLEGAAAPGENGPAMLKDDAGHEIITYIARMPPKPRTDVRPALLIGFHGSGGNAEQLVGAAGAALEHAALRDEYVVIGLKSKAVGWEEADDAPVRAFVAWAIKQYHADPRRIYGLGYSSGAFFLNRFAPSNPELFAGAITYVGGQYGLRKDEHPETAAALYWVVGQKDGTVKADGVLPQMEAFRKAGYSGVYRNMRDLGHEPCKEPTMEDAVRWMQALRNRRLPLAADEQAFIERFADPDKAKRLFNEPGAWQRLIQIGGPQAAAVVVEALTGDKELVRGNAALACRHVMFDQRVVCALAALLDDKSPKLRESALAGLAAQAAWNEGCAQQALCAFAADPKRKPPERRAAAASLGAVARIDLMGSFQAKRAIWTLVGLLDDEDAAVRQVAFASLQVADGVGFDYKPESTKAQRKASCERWAEWCTKACGERPADAPVPMQ